MPYGYAAGDDVNFNEFKKRLLITFFAMMGIYFIIAATANGAGGSALLAFVSGFMAALL